MEEMKTKWTEAPEAVKEFERNNEATKMITEYFPDNRKRWSFYKNEKDKEPVAVFESFFDMSFFVR